jgi:hypothetical protein
MVLLAVSCSVPNRRLKWIPPDPLFPNLQVDPSHRKFHAFLSRRSICCTLLVGTIVPGQRTRPDDQAADVGILLIYVMYYI